MTDSTTGPEADARRAALLAKIAKHNGTTDVVAGDGPPPVDEDLLPENHAAAAEAVAKPATNPFIAALGAILGVGVGIGLILLVVGASNAAHYYGSGDSGAGEIVWGGALAGLGLSALFPLLGAQAVIWHLRAEK